MTPTPSQPILGVDASRMAGRIRTGTENYANQLIRAMLEEPAPWSWRLYFNGNAAEAEIPHRDDIEIRDIPSRRLWTHLRLSREMLLQRPTGLFVPSHVIPLVHAPSVVTIHDIGYLHVPEAHPLAQRIMLDTTTRWSATIARHIIVPSVRTRDDLMRWYGVPSHKITVIHHGVDPRFAALRDKPDLTSGDRYDLPNPYVLAVGTVQPRKNLPLLARAMRHVDDGVDLVVAGKRGWMADQVLEELSAAGLGNRLRLLSYVPDEDLPSLYQRATLMVQPSRFEGFGMPVLEAMASGAPVITTEGSSLREIAGDAAIYFEQDNEMHLAEQIRAILGDNGLRRDIQRRGVAWSDTFTWEHTARKTRTLLQETLLEER